MTTKTEKECWFRIDLPPPITGSYEPAGTWEETGSFRSCKFLGLDDVATHSDSTPPASIEYSFEPFS